MALAASAWVTTEQELKFPVPLAESFFSGFGFALCFVAAAGADITVDAATATPRMLVAAIAPAAMIRRTVWPPRLFTPRRISQRTGSDQGGIGAAPLDRRARGPNGELTGQTPKIAHRVTAGTVCCRSLSARATAPAGRCPNWLPSTW